MNFHKTLVGAFFFYTLQSVLESNELVYPDRVFSFYEIVFEYLK